MKSVIMNVNENLPVKFIIYAPAFDINNGGVIALHRLCHLLRAEGEQAYLWAGWGRTPFFIKGDISRSVYMFIKRHLNFSFIRNSAVGRALKFHVSRPFRNAFVTEKSFDTPFANSSDLKNSIVIYSEVVSGNPLNAPNIVRWFLHKPGFHTGEVKYGQGELYFFYQKAFDDSSINTDQDNWLKVTLVMDHIYRKTNFGSRQGVCYAIRKGKCRPDLPDMKGKVVIDGMSHEEIAELFNKVECFVSYDTATMYSKYAVMCGCKSIVIPEIGVTKEQWRPNEEGRYGIAYGYDDLDYAEKTRQAMFDQLEIEKKLEKRLVQDFIHKCRRFFDGSCATK